MAHSGLAQDWQNLIEDGRWEEARERLEELSRRGSEPDIAFDQLARVWALRGNFQTVISIYLEWAAEAIAAQRTEKAREAIDYALALEPHSIAAHELLLEYHRILRQERDWNQTLVRLSRICLHEGPQDRSLDYLREALQQKPNNLELSLELASTLMALGQIPEAKKQYTVCIESATHQDDSQSRLEARRSLSILEPDNLEIQLQIGQDFLNLGQIEEAESQFRRVLRQDLKNRDALFNLARSCQTRGKFRDALLALNRLTLLYPDDLAARLLLEELDTLGTQVDKASPPEEDPSIAIDTSTALAKFNPVKKGLMLKTESREKPYLKPDGQAPHQPENPRPGLVPRSSQGKRFLPHRLSDQHEELQSSSKTPQTGTAEAEPLENDLPNLPAYEEIFGDCEVENIFAELGDLCENFPEMAETNKVPEETLPCTLSQRRLSDDSIDESGLEQQWITAKRRLSLGLFGEAIQMFCALAETKPDPIPALRQVVNAAIWSDDIELAQTTLWKMVEEHQARQEYRESEEALAQLAILKGTDQKWRQKSVEIHLENGNHKLAAWHLKRSIEYHTAKGETDSATELARTLLYRCPNFLIQDSQAVALLVEAGETEEISQICRQEREQQLPGSCGAHLAFAELALAFEESRLEHFSRREIETRLEALRELLRERPEASRLRRVCVELLLNSGWLCELGKILKESGEIGVYRARVEERYQQESSDPEVQLQWAQFCEQAGDQGTAIEIFQKLRNIPQTALRAYHRLGVHFSQMAGPNMTELALKQFRKGLAVPSASPSELLALRYDLGRLLQADLPRVALEQFLICDLAHEGYRDVRRRIERLRGGLAHQEPTLSMETQGSIGSNRSPACKSSTEIPSGERTKAM